MEKTRTYTGVAVKCKDKVLLGKRNSLGSFPGMWSIFGGKLEPNEETMEGAKREFFEETSIDIDSEKLDFVGLIPRHTRDGKKLKGIMYVYQLNTEKEIIPDLESAIDGEEHTETNYFTIDQLSPEMCGEYLYRLLSIILKK
jgi:8-oxo-dGTP pyrophosphatase MutT (NUDIX family)